MAATVAATVLHICGADVRKHRSRGSAFQEMIALGQLPLSHASLPDWATALAPNDNAGWAAGEMSDRSTSPLLSTISRDFRTAPVAASFTVTTSVSKSPVSGVRSVSTMAILPQVALPTVPSHRWLLRSTIFPADPVARLVHGEVPAGSTVNTRPGSPRPTTQAPSNAVPYALGRLCP